MASEDLSVVIQADQASIAEIKAAIAAQPGTRVQDQQIRAQTGDPATWLLTAKLSTAAISMLSAALVTVFRRNTVTYLKIGGVELRGSLKPDDAERMLKLLKSYEGSTTRRTSKPKT